VYGSLRKGHGLSDLPEELSDLLVDGGACEIKGTLYDLGDYPGLRPGKSTVVGELYKVSDRDKDNRAFRLMDEYERYHAANKRDSLYLRQLVRLQHPDIDAWLYVFNEDVTGRPVIEHGDWVRYYKERVVEQD